MQHFNFLNHEDFSVPAQNSYFKGRNKPANGKTKIYESQLAIKATASPPHVESG